MTKVAIAGYFGWGNFGDQLFLDTVLNLRGDLWPNATHFDILTSATLAGHARRPFFGRLQRLWYSVKVAVTSDVLVYCGGSVFSDLSGVDAVRKILAPRRLQALGVSLGPFGSPEDARNVTSYLRRFERIVFRDDSWQLASPPLNRAHVEQGGDLAALSPRIQSPSHREGIVACPSSAAESEPSIFAKQVKDAHLKLSITQSEPRVTVLALNCHPRLGDVEMADEVVRLLRSDGIHARRESYGDLGLQATCDVLTRAELVVSQRLHGAIVAYLSGGRFVIVGHHPKCVAFVEEIEGKAEIVVSPDNGDIAQAVSAALADETPWSYRPEEYTRRARNTYLGPHNESEEF